MNFKLGLLGVVTLWLQVVSAQPTAFTYQGQLAAGGAPVTGNFDLRFRLFDLANDLVAGPVTNAPVGVTNGLFLTTVDFGSNAFPGAARFLEIGVRTNGSTGAYTVLAPNQPVNSTPYAIQSLYASNAVQLSQPLPATNISGTLAIGLLSTNVALLTTNQTFTAANTFLGVVSATNPANVFGGSFTGAFTGNGSGLVSVPATSLTGILPDTNLSANVPLFSTADHFSNSVTAVQFNGSGYGLTNVPGAFFWLTVNGTNAAAGSNLGFITTNNDYPVFIKLPANPEAGDTFRVAGVGQAGWILLQNSNQTVLAANLAGTAGVTWYPSGSGTQPWSALSSSADGTKLVAAVGGAGKTGYIYYSTNSGITWAQSSSTQNYWSALASSADGSKVVATAGLAGNGGSSGDIFISSNYGATWTAVGAAEQWVSCASSADGSKLVAVSYNGYIGISVNSGGNWNYATEAVTFTGVASSQDGNKLAVCGLTSGGYVYTSINGGTNWTDQPGSGPHPWSAIASSADGSHLVGTATGTGGGIFTSPDGGVTWFQENQNGVNWTSVASSADGSKLTAGYNGGTLTTAGYLYGSVNSGLTWTQLLGATNAPWIAVASSADGSKLAAAAYNGYIYTSGQNVSTSGTNGYLVGTWQSALELQYVGNGVFLPLSHEGMIRAH